MKCKHAKKLISPYIDNELSQTDRHTLAAHIEICPACRQELEKTESVSAMLTAVDRPSAPLGFATRVMAGIDEESEAHGFWRALGLHPHLLKALEVAFALVIVIIGVLSGNMLMTDRATPVQVAELRGSFHLEVFESVPPDSIGGIYVSMTGVTSEK